MIICDNCGHCAYNLHHERKLSENGLAWKKVKITPHANGYIHCTSTSYEPHNPPAAPAAPAPAPFSAAAG